MIQKKWVINKLIPGILFFGSILAIVIYTQWEQHLLKEKPRYTIGFTTGTYWTPASGKKVRFEYKVKGEAFRHSNRYNDKSQVPGRYFVIFSEAKPEVSNILQDKPVPDSIKSAPPDGWEELPIK